jgi:hypothetical protein
MAKEDGTMRLRRLVPSRRQSSKNGQISSGSAAGIPDSAAFDQRARDALSEDLRKAIDAVFQAQTPQTDPDSLREAIQSAVQDVLRSTFSSAPMERVITADVATNPNPTIENPGTVEEVLDRLRKVLQQLKGELGSGVKWSTAAVMKVLPQFIDQVIPALVKILDDEKKVAVFQKSAVTLLGKYMSEKSARRLVAALILAAQQSLKRFNSKGK